MIGLVTNGLLTRLLSPPESGAYFPVLSMISLRALVGSLGLPKAVVRCIAENLTLDQFGRTRRVIYTVLWIGVLGTLGLSLAYLLALFPICMRTSYRRVGSDLGRGCWGLVRDLAEPKILRQKLQKLPAWRRIHVHK